MSGRPPDVARLPGAVLGVSLSDAPGWAIGMLAERTNGTTGTSVALPEDLPTVDLESLSIPDRFKRVAREGRDADPDRYASRSEAQFALLCMLVAAGYDDATIAAILLDPENAAGAKARERGRHWLAGEIARAREKTWTLDLRHPRERAEGPQPEGATWSDAADGAGTSSDAGEQEAGHSGRSSRGAAWPSPPAVEAYHGLAGAIVRTIEPHTEADPVALLIQLLVAFGNVIGRAAHFIVEADVHALNLYAVLVGVSSKGRKGTSLGQVRRLFRVVDSEWDARCILSGLSSGEGLIWQVRDAITAHQAIREKGRATGEYEVIVTDAGVDDKRLLVVEPEFAAPLKLAAREGNSLTATIRQAWDTGTLAILTKNSPARATDAHVSIVGHVTKDELLRYLTTTETANGFANRFLWLCVRRARVLPEGGNLREADLAPLAERLREAVRFGRKGGSMRVGPEARAIWHAVYPPLSEGGLGLFGAATARAEAQVLRLACLYALLDLSYVVRADHLMAALAVWEYCEASARFIFGSNLGDPLADELLRLLRAHPEGQTRTDIRDHFGRNKQGAEVGRALTLLAEHGLARSEAEITGGRAAERWFAL
jgi:hypothetical protein